MKIWTVVFCATFLNVAHCVDVSYYIVSRTTSGGECLSACEVNEGLCYVNHYLQAEKCTVDYLASVPEYHTTTAQLCHSNCGKFGGYDYEWCYTDNDLNWDYCSSVIPKPGTTSYGAPVLGFWNAADKCDTPCVNNRCVMPNNHQVKCIPPASIPVQSCAYVLNDKTTKRRKRSPLDRIFSYEHCSPTCRPRFRDGRDGEVEDRIRRTTTPGVHRNGLWTQTQFPAGSPYSYVATTTETNANGVTVLLPLVVRATLRYLDPMTRTSADIPPDARANVRNMYDNAYTGIEVSHIVGFANGGTRDLFNFIGLTAAANKGPFKVLENTMRYWFLASGYVEMSVVVEYDGTRPREVGLKLKFFNNDGSLHSDCLDVFVKNI